MAPGTERGAAGLKAERLDALSTAMYAIPNEGMNLSVCDPGVRALLVGTGEALGVHPLGCSPPTFHLAPGAYRRRGRSHTRRGGQQRRQAGQSSGVRGLRRRWTVVRMASAFEWEGG